MLLVDIKKYPAPLGQGPCMSKLAKFYKHAAVHESLVAVKVSVFERFFFFNLSKQEKHSKICQKSTSKRRKVFDSSRQRAEGTDISTLKPIKPKVSKGNLRGGARNILKIIQCDTTSRFFILYFLSYFYYTVFDTFMMLVSQLILIYLIFCIKTDLFISACLFISYPCQKP